MLCSFLFFINHWRYIFIYMWVPLFYW
uniref:Uncharacterized protein n=1 Tax=Anguilla anguilla TaxID=7936 RepID=A0A0E9S4S5_ANGAN